jgi:hypothetical protein
VTAPLPTFDDRAVSSTVTTVLAFGITGIVISGLLVGISSFTERQQDRAVRDQMETIGTQLADEHARVAQLAESGGTISITTRYPDRVGGTRYSVSVVTDTASGCNSRLVPSGVERCLRLDAQNPDISVHVPLKQTGNVTVSIDDRGGGSVRLVASGGNATATVRQSPVALDAQVGVGQSAQESSLAGDLEVLNKPPRPDFEVNPTLPRSDVPAGFDAGESSDPDGSIVSYEWDLDDDGDFEEIGQRRTESLDPGAQEITLRVTDEDETTATLSKNISVSGLEYERDLTTKSRDTADDTVAFTVRNTWNQPVTLSELFVDPRDTSIDELQNDTATQDEVAIDTEPAVNPGTDATVTFDQFADVEIPPAGTIIDLNQFSGGVTLSGDQTVPSGERAEITLGNFDQDVDGNRIDFAIGYIVDGGTNTTTFTYAAAPELSEYEVESGPTINVTVSSSHELDDIDVEVAEVGGPFSATLDETDFASPASGPPYTYRATDITSGTGGTFNVNVTGAESTADVGSSSTPLDQNATTSFVWKNGTDWNDGQSESGVVHDSFGDREGDVLSLGYPAVDRGGSNLTGYWTFDRGSGNTVVDVTSNGNNASIRGEGQTDNASNSPIRGVTGLHGTGSWKFNTESGSEDAVYIDSTETLSGGSETTLTAAAWIDPSGGSVQSHNASIVGKQESDTAGDWGLTVGESCPDWAECGGTPPYVGYRGKTGGDNYGLYEHVSFTDRWHHVAVVVNEPDDEVSVFVDGSLAQRESGASNITANTSHPVEIGRTEHLAGGSSDPNFEGKIDDVRIYNRTLSNSEVAALHETGTQGTYETSIKSGPSVDPDDMQLEWSGSIPDGTEVTVELRDSGDDGHGEVTLTHDSGSKSFDPAGDPGPGTDYYLVVELHSNSATKTPEIDRLALGER